MLDKPLFWLGSSRNDLKAFSPDARRIAGFQLRRVQQGLEPNDWKPMPTVGPGVWEIRIRTGLEQRVFYVAKFTEGVYVVHAFEKRTRKRELRGVTGSDITVVTIFQFRSVSLADSRDSIVLTFA